MNVYDEDKSFRLFNKYCNNNFVCVVSKWGKKTHQEINREYKGKYLEDIYAVNGREMSKISLKYKDENGKLMIARNNNLNILSRSEMLENVLSYIEKYYNIVCKDNFDYFLKQIRDNWCCIVSNDEYCIEIFETKSAVGSHHSCIEVEKERDGRILAVMDNINDKCFKICSKCLSRYLDMSKDELKKFDICE